MTRPDFQGGDSRLGYSTLYGRLLNEGPYGMLDLNLDLLPPDAVNVWTTVHARIEGDSFWATDPGMGILSRYNITQMYVQAGNVLIDKVTWQIGTLDYWLGQLGLYDIWPARVFRDTVGLSGMYRRDNFEVLVGLGDAGFFARGSRYNTIFSGGGLVRYRPIKGLELGLGGQGYYEPKVAGNRFAPYQTPLPNGITYEDVLRRRVVQTYDQLFPNQLDAFPNPKPVSNTAYKFFAYLGFGDLGPLRWNSLYLTYENRLPDSFFTETFNNVNYDIYVASLTDNRNTVFIGDEMQLRLIPNVLDLTLSGILGIDTNADNSIASGEDNRRYISGLARFQGYITREVHVLFETSYAVEDATLGNLWREHYDSVFTSTGGLTDVDGLEFGDTDQRRTLQLKAGLVLSPLGPGIYTRPALRILYGAQYSNAHNSFGNSFSRTLDERADFPETKDRHWHSVVALEAEAWF